MPQFNPDRSEVSLKIVYYGPALSGKTSNLQSIARRMTRRRTGRLIKLDTWDDRTLFCDLLPVYFKTPSGTSLRIKLVAVPGQRVHDATRGVVLDEADGVVFIADGQLSASQANQESFASLESNLKANGAALDQIPLVIQFNKRDLGNIKTEADLDSIDRVGRSQTYWASAINDMGVFETLRAIITLIWAELDRTCAFSSKMGIEKDAFLDQILGMRNPRSPRRGKRR